MADGSLYDTDFVAWTEQQARLLREAQGRLTNAALDWDNLVEEIESLGRSDLRELRSHVQVIIEHLLKLQYSPGIEPRRKWKASVDHARVKAEQLLEESPSLAAKLDRSLAKDATIAARVAAGSLQSYDEVAQAALVKLHGGAYTIEQILGDWFPDAPG